MTLSEDERRTAETLYKEEFRSPGVKLAHRIGNVWNDSTREELVHEWLTLSSGQQHQAESRTPEGLREEVLEAVRAEERKRKREERRQRAAARAQRAEALGNSLGHATGRVHRAACSRLSRSDMRLAGLSVSECDEAMTMRKGAMALTAAALHIGVPKGRLDRWERSGLAQCSFTRRISMAKMVTARFWTKEDAERIRGRVPMLEAHDAARRKRMRRERKSKLTLK